MLVQWTSAQPEPAAVERMESVLHAGGIAVFPTETLYGLGCDPHQERAVRGLVELKGRRSGMALPLIAASPADARALVRPEPACEKAWQTLAETFWPGPLTVVVTARPGLAPDVLAGGKTVGVRVSSHPVARRLAELCGGGIVATSANRSGESAVTRVENVDPTLTAGVDLVVDGGGCPGGLPSTVILLRAGELEVLRAGAVAPDALRACGLRVRPESSGS